MKIHFIGIGGEGMCGVAKLALALGHQVSGSELAKKNSLIELQKLGAKIYSHHLQQNVNDTDLVVRSSVIPQQHIEVVAAREKGKEVIKRATCLARLLESTGQKMIVVAGTSGKSSTAAMLGKILDSAGYDPTVIVGAYVPFFKSHARIGKGKIAVIEACEYDRSFLEFHSESAIITNIGADHLDYYKGGLQEIIQAFIKFACQVNHKGILIVCKEDPTVKNYLLPAINNPVITYGFGIADWQAEILPIRQPGQVEFNVYCLNQFWSKILIKMPGRHAVLNSLATISLADHLGVKKDIIRKSLGEYSGIYRRFERKQLAPGILLIDDYGHTPREIQAVISTIKDTYRPYLITICCLKQFHRTKRLLNEFAEIIAQSDASMIMPIVKGLGDDEQSIIAINQEDVASAIRLKNSLAFYSHISSEAVQKIQQLVQDHQNNSNVVILIIGSGETSEIRAELIKVFHKS